MSDEVKKFRRFPGRGLIPSMVTLAFWRLRHVWKLLLVTGLGLMIAVMVVCIVPLYSDLAMTAGLRSALTTSVLSNDVIVQSQSEQVSASSISDATRSLNHVFRNDLNPFLGPDQFTFATHSLSLLKPLVYSTGPGSDDPAQYQADISFITLFGMDLKQAGQHMHLRQGHLPQDTTQYDTLEIGITAESASYLHISLGSYLTTSITFTSPVEYGASSFTKTVTRVIHLYVVGIFDSPSLADPFWHDQSFVSSSHALTNSARDYTALLSQSALSGLFSSIASAPDMHDLLLEPSCILTWHYPLNASRATIYDLDTLITGVHNAQTDASNLPALNQGWFIEKTTTYQPSDLLQEYKDRVPVAQIPTVGILLLVLGLALFFVSMMTDMLAERQGAAIAILRSRGASRAQIFGSFITQAIGLGLLALLVGVPLALLVVVLLARNTLADLDPDLLNIFVLEPGQIVAHLCWYALITAAISTLTMIIAVGRHNVLSILDLRRDEARPGQRALWQRLGLDIVAALIALVLYGLSLYIVNAQILDAQLRLLLLAPVTLAGVICLLVAGMLLFLRFFPLLLSLCAYLVRGNRGVAATLALAQMARAPKRSIRLLLLLILATTFAQFALIFTATETARSSDVANYEVGSDFSGEPFASYEHADISNMIHDYQQVQGVLAASPGFSGTATANVAGESFPMAIRAVDADTFAQTAIWSSQNSTQPLKALMQLLRSRREAAIASNVVPAIVDTGTWNALNLHLNEHFALQINDSVTTTYPITFIAVAEIGHIPTVNDGDASASTGDNLVTGGILADLQTYAPVYINVNEFLGVDVQLNYVWLKTENTPDVLVKVRKLLSDKNLCCLTLVVPYDRRAQINATQADPLYLNLIGILAIAALTALVLALLGNFVASWLSVSSRLANFAVLRALGANPLQIAQVLVWEQGITYVLGIAVGCVAGIVLSVVVLPYIVYSSAASSSGTGLTSVAFYLTQSEPPVQVVLPFALILLALVLLLMCIIAIFMMVRVVARPSTSQVLRLNAD